MSNYPPGVTGRELQIAGPSWEGAISRVCSSRDVEITVVSNAADHLDRLTEALGEMREGLAGDKTARALARLLTSTSRVQVAECFFSGEVDAWEYGGTMHWVCPMCESEHEEWD